MKVVNMRNVYFLRGYNSRRYSYHEWTMENKKKSSSSIRQKGFLAGAGLIKAF